MVAKKIEKLISTFIAIAAITSLIILLWSVHGAFGNFTDFPEYYAASKLILSGHGSSVYVLSEMAQMQHQLFPTLARCVIPVYLPPQGLILFTPIALVGLPLAFYIWKILLVACLIGSVVMLRHTFSLDYKKTCYLIAGLALCHATFEILRIDQIGAQLLFALSATLYFLQQNKDAKAGLFLSFMIVKPQFILPFLVYLIGLRRWRPVSIFIGVALFLTILAYLLMGSTGFSNYVALLRAPMSTSFMQPDLMPTVRGQLLRLCPELSTEILYISVVIFLAVAFCSWFCGADNRNHPKAILWAFLITIPLTQITSLHCHSYDLLLLVPTVLIIFTDAVLPFSEFFKLIMIIGGLIFMIPLAIFIHYFYLLKGGPINIWFVELLIMELAICKRLIFSNKIE